MNISSAKSPYLLQVERSNRPKATYGNRFRIALDSEKAESQVSETAEEEEATKEFSTEDPNADFALPAEEESKDEYCYNITDEEAEYFLEKYGEKFNDSDPFKLFDELAETQDDVDPLQVMEEMTGKISASKPSYTVTEEQAEYFREKYGGEYDEEKARDFFLELSENKVISWVDAFETLGLNTIVRAYGTTKCIDTETNTVSYITNSLKAPEYKKSYLTDTSFESAYVKFERQYDKAVETWQDYVQKQLDFYSYLIESDEIPKDSNGEVPFSKSKAEWNMGFKSRYNTIEKVAGVVDQIFGEVTL